MKRILLSSLAVFGILLAQAQIKKGDILLGGNLGYYSQTIKSDPPSFSSYKNSSLYINPSFGKAIKDNLILGFDINYGHSLSEPDTVNKSTQNSFGAGIFVRRYKALGNGFFLFGQSELSGAFNHNKYNSTNGSPGFDENHNDGYNFTLQFFPGIAYAINRRWQIETSLPNFLYINYNHTGTRTVYASAPEQKSSNNSFQLSSSLTGSNQFTVGVRYIIGS